MMDRRVSFIFLLCILALTPISASADGIGIEVSDVQITAFASFSSQIQPEVSAFDAKTAPPGSLTKVEVLVPAGGKTFPNIPTSQLQAFASSAANADKFYGVGVNGFFFPSSLPPHALVASGTDTQTITNNSGVTVGMTAGLFVPAPTVQFFGVGEDFPIGADPARAATAAVNIRLLSTLTHPDGSKVETIHLDYGIQTFLEPISGVTIPLPSRDAAGFIERFDVGLLNFGFRLPDLDKDFDLGDIGPGDSLEVTFDYFAQASTGFGETGVFAAIGDPFNLSTGGGHFSIQVGDAAPSPNPVPEPATMLLLGTGLAGIGGMIKRRRHAKSV